MLRHSLIASIAWRITTGDAPISEKKLNSGRGSMQIIRPRLLTFYILCIAYMEQQ